MTRTLSGSFISNLTKRPTPEPSESGSHDAEIEDMIFNDVSPARAYRGDDGDVMPPEPLHDLGLETPQASPMLADQDDFGPQPDSGNNLGDDRSVVCSVYYSPEPTPITFNPPRSPLSRKSSRHARLSLTNCWANIDSYWRSATSFVVQSLPGMPVWRSWRPTFGPEQTP